MVDKKSTYEELEKQIANLKKELELKDKTIQIESQTNLSILDHMLEGCQVIGEDWRFIYINNSAVVHSGLSKDKFIGNKITDVWPGFEKTELYQIMKDSFRNGTPRRFESDFQFPNGKVLWYDLSIQRIPQGLFILSIDITDKKKIAEVLSEKSKKFQIVFESANVAKSITLPTGELEVNQAFCDMLGYTKHELQTKKWQEITPKEDIPQIEKRLKGIFEDKEESTRFTKRYVHKKGHYIWADISAVMHRDEKRNPLFFIATIIDITKQKKVEELVRYQKELLEEMGEIAKIGAWEFDPESGEGTWTDEVARIHDLDPGLKTNVELGVSFYTDDSRIKINKAIKEAVEKKKPYELELELISAKGNKKWIRTHGNPVVQNNKVIKVRGSFQDITERKNIEKKLRKNEKMMETLLANLPGVAYRCKNNKNWEMEFLSEGCYELTGYESQELLGRTRYTFNDLIHPEDREMVWGKVQAAIQTKATFEIEYRIITKDNKIKWVWEQGKKTKTTKPEVLEGFISDISERKQALLALAESEERFAKTFHSSPAGLVISSVSNNIYIDVNESFTKILGYKPEEIIGFTHQDLKLLSKTDLKKISTELKEKGKIRNVELQLNCNHNKKITILFSNELIELNGNLCRISTVIDITERKKTLEELRDNEKRLRNAQNIARIGDYIWEVEKDKINFSDSLKNILGYSKKNSFNLEFVRKNIHHPEDTKKIMAWMENNLKSGNTLLTPFEYRVLKKDKSQIFVRTLGVIKRKNKKPIQVIATVQDITEYKLAELEINKLNRELEERVKERTSQLESINKELKTFTYSVSHDLKAPLRGIDGYSKLLQEYYLDKLDDEGKQFLANIREGTLQMNQLIEDLLAYSRLERTSMTMSKVSGGELIGKLLKSYQNEFDEKQIKLNTDFSDFTVNADYNALSMALRNILDNAVKFTKGIVKPEITIGLYENSNTSTIYVKDNGIGFDTKYHDKIFEIFQRLQRVEDYPGTGIGLALVSKSMQRIGGRVWADSEPGKGATFYLELLKN